MKTRGRLLVAIPVLALLLLLTGVLLALPAFVSSATHRATIEALASALTGRQVHIGGRLSLSILPTPQLSAERITISGPAQEIVTARSLTLDIAVPALLRGRLSARSLTLQSPTINIPWPLPPGTAAVPPAWLTALHAQIADGTVSIGAISFTHVAADIFTAGDGGLSVSGNATLDGQPLDISLSLGAPDAVGHAPVALDAKTNDGKFTGHLSGTFDGASEISATLNVTASLPSGGAPVSATADIDADRAAATARNLRLRQANATLTGTASLDFPSKAVTAVLDGQNLNLSALEPLARSFAGLPVRLSLAATNSTYSGMTIPRFQTEADCGPNGIMLRRLEVMLPGGGEFSGSFSIAQSGRFSGQGDLATANLPALLTTYGASISLPGAWTEAHFAAALQGDETTLTLSQLRGAIGPAHLTGNIGLTRTGGRIMAIGQLHFDQLDLTPLWAMLRSEPGGWMGFGAEGEITADRAIFYHLPMTRLLLDAAYGPQLTVRQFSASVDSGLVTSSFTLAPGNVITAHALLAVPSAAPLAALLPAGWQPPAMLAHSPLAVLLLGAGPAKALTTSAVATLGDLQITAAPVVDLSQPAAAGAFTLRYPSAIGAFTALGFKAGLNWPGAGSISVRADLSLTPAKIALPDFVVSLGDLTASGQFMASADGGLAGDVSADTLALPPIPRDITIPWGQLAKRNGTIRFTANRVLLGGQAILGPATASLILAPQKLTLIVPQASLANGNLTASLTAAAFPTAPPLLTAKLNVAKADAAAIALPFAFPLSLPSGLVTAQAVLSASGYTPAAWGATLAGTLALSASNGAVNGFSLAGLAQALKAPSRAAALRTAANSGSTGYTTMTANGSFDHGSYNFSMASLQGPEGSATANGSIDIPDAGLALDLTLRPNVTPPFSIGVITIGGWTAPKQIVSLDSGLNWQATP